ncbi:MAG TPA: DUF2975 domain-containing protein [Candidatus Paceibacterota bacterium]|nr:DUF2975 domain-containing protein [Candidatus Paceibacterota bacterium]
MKKGSTWFLRGVVCLVGIAALALCLFVLPIGLRGDATGMYKPIVLGMYVSAIPFFWALYQTLKLLGYVDKNTAFSELSVRALKNIKYCAFVVSGLYTIGTPYIFHVADKDDAPGVVAITLVIIFASFVIAVFAAVLQRLLQNAIEIKSENDLTV